jgi:hypothetical protein
MDNKLTVSDKEISLRAAIRSALGGESILFLGAGAAKDAEYDTGKPLPTGQELADLLAKTVVSPMGIS